jgi:2-dehydro-3-deoxygluconokinase
MGEVLGLLLAETEPLDEAMTFRRSVAGAEANVAVGLARLGHRVCFAGRVGDDTFGRDALRRLRGEGVSVEVRVDPTRPTGLIVRDCGRARPVTVWYRRDGSAATATRVDDVPLEALAGARLLHLTGITAMLSPTAHAAVQHAIATARRLGVTVCLDPNVRLRLASAADWAVRWRELASLADVVLIGEDEADVLGVPGRPEWLLDNGVSTVVVKRGARGAVEHDQSGSTEAVARPIPLADPVGAGDAFAAGWISGWLDGLARADRLHRAGTVAAQVVAYRGDLDGLPTRAVLDQISRSAITDVLR